MADARRVGTLGVLALASLLASGCAAATSGTPRPVPVRLTAEEKTALADILRIEDAREVGSPLLRALTGSPSPVVRRYAAVAVGRVRDTEARPALERLLADPDTAVAASAAFAIGQLGDSAGVPALAALLADGAMQRAPTAASEAAYALGKLRSGAARSALDSLLRRAADNPDTRAVVGSALLAAWRFPRPDDVGSILRWTGSADPEVRWRATYALVRRPTPAATPALQRLASDPDPRVRALAVRGLTAPMADSAGVGGATTLPLVLAAARDTAYPVRISALRSLATYRDERAVQALVAALGDDAGHPAVVAAEALGRLGASAAPAAPALRSLALRAGAPQHARQMAVEALARVAPAEAREVGERLASAPEWRLRASAARALSVAAGFRAATPQRLLRDPDPRVAHAAMQALGEAAGDSLAALRPLVLEALGARDVMVRAAALAALERLRDPATLPLLLDAYDRAQRDTLNDAALAAVDALWALQRAGQQPARAFFARFPRPADLQLRLRVRDAFGAEASAWGSPLPLETGRTADDYRLAVERWIVPVLAGGPRPRALIETEQGSIELRLFADDAPLTVASFAGLAGAGYFDGQEWPRVVPNFVVQGGDPRGDTNGGPGYTIRDEINRHRYGTGSLGMALAGPDTGGSQFFITHSPQPHLDGIYTLFGEVESGGAVLERLLPGDRLVRVRMQP